MKEAKRKAEELVKKYDEIFMCERVASDSIIDCALFNVEEIIDTNPIEVRCLRDCEETISLIPFWQEVRNELNKMK